MHYKVLTSQNNRKHRKILFFFFSCFDQWRKHWQIPNSKHNIFLLKPLATKVSCLGMQHITWRTSTQDAPYRSGAWDELIRINVQTAYSVDTITIMNKNLSCGIWRKLLAFLLHHWKSLDIFITVLQKPLYLALFNIKSFNCILKLGSKQEMSSNSN